MRKMDAGSIETVKWIEIETVNGIGSDGKKRRSESRGRTRTVGRGESVTMERTPTKRERRRVKRKRSMFGKREGMRIPVNPQDTVKLTNLTSLLKMLKRKKM